MLSPWALCDAFAYVLGWVTAPFRLGIPRGADRCEHCALSHTGTSPNVRNVHLAKGVHSPVLREGVKVPDHLRHLFDVSPLLQVLAMGFSWALYVCQKMVESCARASGFSPDILLMDRHRAPAMTRDSICFGVFVDGVCAVGCDRPKVLAAMTAVKATLDAAGLQCSEVEAGISRQIFTGLQLDHESGILSLEDSRIWRLRRGLEFAACQMSFGCVRGDPRGCSDLCDCLLSSLHCIRLQISSASSGAVADMCREVSKDSMASVKPEAHDPLESMEFLTVPPAADPGTDEQRLEKTVARIRATLRTTV